MATNNVEVFGAPSKVAGFCGPALEYCSLHLDNFVASLYTDAGDGCEVLRRLHVILGGAHKVVQRKIRDNSYGFCRARGIRDHAGGQIGEKNRDVGSYFGVSPSVYQSRTAAT